ncbi:MAG: NAD(P)-dependent oxidoreductase, partial [Proteobacteria bacterium]|nr:NAD(P)-dependent oxidoreductase [Pseudomonadota bacterium]
MTWTALVTGATGFIGSALTKRLARDGIWTWCLVREGSPRLRVLAGLKGVELIQVPSFGEAELTQALRDVRPDVIFHLAAAGVNPSHRDPASILDGNAGILRRLLLASRPLGVQRFVYAGSCSEYAEVKPGVLIDESHPLSTQSLYGASKAATHLFGTALSRHLGIPFVTLRLFGTFGVGEALPRLVPYLVSHLERGELPKLTGGEQSRDFTYIDDVVEAFLLAATTPTIDILRAYNVCSGNPVRVCEVAQCVARLMGKPSSALGLGSLPYRSDESMWIVGDGSAFRQATGWWPR